MDIAALIVSHNNPTLTDALCNRLRENTKGVGLDVYVVETGSELSLLSKNTTLWTAYGVRMTNGWNLLKEYADTVANLQGKSYFAYHLFVNDAIVPEGVDMVAELADFMEATENCAQIHPYMLGAPPPYGKQEGCRASLTSFSEIICPLISARFWEKKPWLLDPDLFYGWGLDYEMPYHMHKDGWRAYQSNIVGVGHIPFTSYRERETTKEKLTQSAFMSVARKNMNEVLTRKYGPKWGKYFLDNVPPDVPKDPLLKWLQPNDPYSL